jgi:cytochrome c oxidase cbb3-type subunit 2
MNSLKSFVLVLGACIGVPTYIMAVRPYATERKRQQVPYQASPDPANPAATPPDAETLKGLSYPPAFAGDSRRGELVYVREGCAQCHTQVIRPDYAGNDRIKRYAGREQEYKKDVPTPVRQTHMWDYMHEDFAMFGIRRVGPDLANAGYRFPTVDKNGAPDPGPVARLYRHLYNPRSIPDREWSNCPSMKHLFVEKLKESPQGRADALQPSGSFAPAREGYEIVPTAEAKALVQYLLGLKRDHPIPASISGAKPKAQ